MNAEWCEINRAIKVPGGDGQSCAVDVCGVLAKFYRVRALPDTNSVGDPVEPFTLETGSGHECKDWALRTSYMIARGLVGIGKPEADS